LTPATSPATATRMVENFMVLIVGVDRFGVWDEELH
jgi:hypothetical protein